MTKYPETHEDGVGHVFNVDPDESKFFHPSFMSAYSLGNTGGEKHTRSPLLRDAAGNTVDCKSRHGTCECLRKGKNGDAYFLVATVLVY